MCVDGQSFELYAEDNDAENLVSPYENPEEASTNLIEISEYHLAAEAIKHKPLPGWSLTGNEDWADVGIV